MEEGAIEPALWEEARKDGLIIEYTEELDRGADPTPQVLKRGVLHEEATP